MTLHGHLVILICLLLFWEIHSVPASEARISSNPGQLESFSHESIGFGDKDDKFILELGTNRQPSRFSIISDTNHDKHEDHSEKQLEEKSSRIDKRAALIHVYVGGSKRRFPKAARYTHPYEKRLDELAPLDIVGPSSPLSLLTTRKQLMQDQLGPSSDQLESEASENLMLPDKFSIIRQAPPMPIFPIQQYQRYWYNAPVSPSLWQLEGARRLSDDNYLPRFETIN